MQAEHQKQLAPGDWRHMVAACLHHTGLLRAFQAVSRRCELASDNGGGGRLRRVQKPKYVVLGYHSVGIQGLPLYCRLPKRAFAEQMSYIRRYYRVLSLRQMVEELRNPGSQEQGVVVTFDDGYLGTYTNAFPVLREYDIPATVYLIAGSVETGELAWYDQIFLRLQRVISTVTVTLDTPRNFRLTDFASRVDAAMTVVCYLLTLPDEERREWCGSFSETVPLRSDELNGAMMNWDQVREMRRAGISFGSHTMTHPVLSRLTPNALQQEVAESKRLIESRLAAVVEDFSFPFGDCETIGAPVLSALGLHTGVTTIPGVNKPGADRFRLRRLILGEDVSIPMFACRLQQLFFHPTPQKSMALTIRADA